MIIQLYIIHCHSIIPLFQLSICYRPGWPKIKIKIKRSFRIILERLTWSQGNTRVVIAFYYMAELVRNEKENSDWFP